MSGPWRSMSVMLTANTSAYTAGMARASAATKGFGSTAAATTATVEKSGGRWRAWSATIAKGATVAGLAIGAAAAMSIAEAIKWESALAGVAKTVDGTEAEIAALGDGIVDMANRMPATREEIAGVAEAAGQLGVKKSDILGFTETMIGLGTATNLSSEEAATGLAQLMNVMGTAPEDVERLASTLVDLGNKGASTEAEILDMATRLSGAATIIGATESDVLALSNAMASMGIRSQMGGGAMQRVLLDIDKAAAEGGEAVAGFADVAGMSADEFAAAWEADPIAATDDLIQGLAGVQASGGNVAAVLDDLGIKGTQNQQVMLQLTGAEDLLSESLDNGTAAWDKNNALADEVAKRYGTAESQLAIFRNQVTNVGRELGGVLVPGLLLVVDYAREVGGWLGDRLPAAGAALRPVWDDIYEAGSNLVEILGDMWDVGGQAVEMLASFGGAAILGAITGLAQAFASVTDYIAENEWAINLLLGAMIALGANKAIQTLRGQWYMFSEAARLALARVRSSNFALQFTRIKMGVQDMGGAAVGAFRNANNYTGQWTTGVRNLRGGMRNLRGSLSNMLGGSGPLILFTAAVIGVMNAQSNAKAQAEEWRGELEADIDTSSISSVASAVREAEAEQRRATAALNDEGFTSGFWTWDRWGAAVRNVYQQLTPAENTIADLAAAQAEAGETADYWSNRQDHLTSKLEATASKAGTTLSAVQEWVDTLDLDPTTQSSTEMAEAIEDAALKAQGGVPATDNLAAAVEVLGDETATATDQMEAWKDTMDSIIGVQVSAERATDEWAKAVPELTWQLAGLGSGITGMSGEAIDSRLAIQDMVDQAIEMAEALGNTEGPDAAVFALAGAREQIIEAGTAAGVSREEMEGYLEQLGLTPDQITTTLDLEGVDTAEEQLGAITGENHLATVEVQAEIDDETVQYQASILAASFSDLTEPVNVELNGERFFPTAGIVSEWVRTYDDASPMAEALLNTGGAQLGFTSLSGWSRFYESLDPTTRAQLETNPADVDFAALHRRAQRWREANPTTTAHVDTAEAERRLNEVARDRTSTIEARIRAVEAMPRDWIGSGSSAGERRGAIHSYAAGGVTRAHVTRDMLFRYGEPETGGEAFIPRRGDRDRSLAILEQAAAWFGMGVIPMVGGGVVGGADGAATGAKRVTDATDDPLADWRANQTTEAREWSEDIATMVEDAYDSDHVADVLAAGPEAARPILDESVAGLSAAHDDMAAGTVRTVNDMAAAGVGAAAVMRAGVGAEAVAMAAETTGTTAGMAAVTVDTTRNMAAVLVGTTANMATVTVGTTANMATVVGGITSNMAAVVGGNAQRMADNLIAGTNRGVDTAIIKLYGGAGTAGSISRNYAGSLRDALNPILTSVGARPIGLNRGGWAVPGPNIDADVVPAMLTPGEYVWDRDTVDRNRGLIEAIHQKKIDGLQGFATGGDVLMAAGHRLRAAGASITGHAGFGSPARPGVHADRSYHYRNVSGTGGDAFDASTVGGQSAAEQAFFDEWAPRIAAMGLRVLWRVAGHFDHMHVDLGPPGYGIGGFTGQGWDPMPDVPDMPVGGDVGRAGTGAMTHTRNAIQSYLSTLFAGGPTASAPALKAMARDMLDARGWAAHWAAFDQLVDRESSWNPRAQNPDSTAYGLAQFLDSTWGGYGPKTSDPRLQLEYMLDYIADRYGNPTRALDFHRSNGWYHAGGPVTVHTQPWDTPGVVRTAPPGLNAFVNGTGAPEQFTPVGRHTVGLPSGGSPTINIEARVFVGDREITDIARVEATTVVGQVTDRRARVARMGAV